MNYYILPFKYTTHLGSIVPYIVVGYNPFSFNAFFLALYSLCLLAFSSLCS